MKTFKYLVNVVLFAELPIYRESITPTNHITRINTHKLEMIMTAQMLKDHKELGEFTNSNGRPLGLGVINGNNNLVIQLQDSAAQKLADTAGVPLDILPLVAKNAKLSITYQLREAGDIVYNSRTDEDITIERTHVQIAGIEMTLDSQARQDVIYGTLVAKEMSRERKAHVAVSSASTAKITDDNAPQDFPTTDDDLNAGTSNVANNDKANVAAGEKAAGARAPRAGATARAK